MTIMPYKEPISVTVNDYNFFFVCESISVFAKGSKALGYSVWETNAVHICDPLHSWQS